MIIDHKITTWERVDIDTSSDEDRDALLEFIKSTKEVTVNQILEYACELGLDRDYEALADTEEAITPADNADNATIEVYESRAESIKSEPLWDNSFAKVTEQCRLIFGRVHGFQVITELAICTFWYDPKLGPGKHQLLKAVATWLGETEEGKEAYQESCEDFNIGDLALKQQASLLSSYGIHNLKVEITDCAENYLSFDKHLAHYDA